MPKKNVTTPSIKKVKVPKVITMFCAICEQTITRDTFVAHVREHLSSGEENYI